MSGEEQAHRAMAAAAAALGRGDLPAAEQGFAEAASIAPGLADAWFNLGWVQRARRRFAEALASYAQALSAGVSGPEEAHVNRAAILADHLFRPAEAIAEYDRALVLRPGYPPALAGLAQLHEDEGRAADARDCYRRLLQQLPGDGRAAARLALLDLGDGDPHAVISGLDAALSQARSSEDRAELLFALATALDRAGKHPDAFRTVAEANALAASLSRRRYRPELFEMQVERLIAAFPAPLAEAEPADTGPIFICGLFRSGSTLAEQILARHPALVAAGELEAIPALASGLKGYPGDVPRLGEAERRELRGAYLGEARRAIREARRFTDKRCDNFEHLGLIQTIFPGAPVVHTRRHPLDNLLSTYFLRFGEGVAYGHRLEDAVHHAVQHERLMRHWERIMPGRIHSLDYDRLVRAPEAELRPLAAFLGLEWDGRLLGTGGAATVRTASNWQVRQPLHSRSSGRWRHYADELAGARRMFEAAGMTVGD